VAAMDFELSRDMLRSQQLSDDLRKSEARMTLATEAASLGIWNRDLITNDIWATEKWRELLGFSQSQAIDFDGFLRKLHPDDCESVVQTQTMAVNGVGSYETEYRVVLPDEGIRWISSRGRVEFNDTGQPILVRGVSMDITHRKLAELKVVQQRNELAHLSRVTTLGEISGSLAHELNQPLGAILANTEAVEMHLQNPTVRMDVVRQILADIRRDDLRAGEIIHGMRAFLRRREFDMQPIALEDLAREAVRLVSAEASTRQITIGINISPQLSLVLGDRTCLTQVMVNLLVNAMDAVGSCIAPYRHVTIQASQVDPSSVDIGVIDAGVGISAADINRVFEPFHTTKQGGLGLGLAICRSIIEAHGSSILISNNTDRGATARFSLSTCSAEA
jgi:two-component system sensor kinase FixL